MKYKLKGAFNLRDDNYYRHGYWEERFITKNIWCGNFHHGIEVGIWYLIDPNERVISKSEYNSEGTLNFLVQFNNSEIIYVERNVEEIHVEEIL